MRHSRTQRDEGMLPQGGSNGEVHADRASRASRPKDLAIASPQSHDLGSPRVVGHGKTPSSIRLTGRLLTPKEAAEFLGVPESTLAQWRSQGRGPLYVKLESRLVRYRATDLESYILSSLRGSSSGEGR